LSGRSDFLFLFLDAPLMSFQWQRIFDDRINPKHVSPSVAKKRSGEFRVDQTNWRDFINLNIKRY